MVSDIFEGVRSTTDKVNMMKNNVISLCGFADIDVPVIEETPTVESEEPEIMLVNPCTGLPVLNVRTGNLVDVGGSVYGTGCDELEAPALAINDMDNTCSNSMFDDFSSSFSSSDDSFSNDAFDTFSSDTAFDDFC